MMKFNLKRDAFPLLVLVLVSVFIGWVYPELPDELPIHWGTSGEVDRYMSKPFGAVLGVLLAIGVYLFFYIQLIIDPLRRNHGRFADKYWVVRDLLILLLAGINLYSVLWALGHISEPNLMVGLVSISFIVLGNYLPTFKRNWFLGIKTPWTLSSEDSWNKTHRLVGKLFVITGLIGVVEAMFSSGSAIFLTATIVTITVSVGYSYLMFSRGK